MVELTLHEDPISGNCYKIKLTASLTSQPLHQKQYSILKGETRTPDFLQNVSSYGRIPVLQIGQTTFLPESNAACYYIAESAKSSLIPSDTLLKSKMLGWMFFEQNQLEGCLGSLRFWLKSIGKDKLSAERLAQIPQKIQQGEEVLQCMNEHLAQSASGWFAGENVTLADIVLYAYTHVAHEGGFDLQRYPKIVEWFGKIAHLDNYIPM